MQVLAEAREGIRSFTTGVGGHCEPEDIDVGTEPGFTAKTAFTLRQLVLPPLQAPPLAL